MIPAIELDERDSILETIRVSYRRAIKARSVRSMMLLGPRGSGRTDLLNNTAEVASQEGVFVSRIESPISAGLAHLLYPEMLRLLRFLSGIEAAEPVASRGLRGLLGFTKVHGVDSDGLEDLVGAEPGLADSGDLHYDFPALFTVIGEAARAAGNAWVIIMDEVQCLMGTDLAALIAAFHGVSQGLLPVLFIGAGDQQVARLAGEAAAYAERLFVFVTVGGQVGDS